MTVTATGVACPYCEQAHGPEVLCPPARRVLDALHARGLAFTGIRLDLPDPVPAARQQLAMQPGDALVAHLSVKAGTVEVGGVHRPLLALSGIVADGSPLPRWLYAADGDTMHRLAQLVTITVREANQRAEKKRVG